MSEWGYILSATSPLPSLVQPAHLPTRKSPTRTPPLASTAFIIVASAPGLARKQEPGHKAAQGPHHHTRSMHLTDLVPPPPPHALQTETTPLDHGQLSIGRPVWTFGCTATVHRSDSIVIFAPHSFPRTQFKSTPACTSMIAYILISIRIPTPPPSSGAYRKRITPHIVRIHRALYPQGQVVHLTSHTSARELPGTHLLARPCA